MLVCRNAEGIRGQEKVGNHCSRIWMDNNTIISITTFYTVVCGRFHL